MSKDWFIYANDEEKHLYVSREKPNPSGAFSPCNMSPDDVDYEMSKGKNKKILEICGMEQKSFEYFIEKYGEEKGSKIRYAEAFEVCEYGNPLTDELYEKLFSF